jgi:hypothetical protein
MPCHYAECRVLFITMLNNIELSVIMLIVIVLSVIMVNVIMLNVVMLNVVAPQKLSFIFSWREKRQKKTFSLLSFIYIGDVFCQKRMRATFDKAQSVKINRLLIRHDRNPRFSKSPSHLKIYYSRLTHVISRLLIINIMLPTRLKWDRH